MKSNGNYIEIAGGIISEKYEEDYSIYTGGHLKFVAAKSINQTGADGGITFNAAQTPPPVPTEKTDDLSQEGDQSIEE